MSKRDHLSEILGRKKRSAEPSRISAFAERHAAIGQSFERLLRMAPAEATSLDPELCRYFPIALVAAVEGYFRQVIADLTDIGEPYKTRVAGLVRRLPKPEVAAAVSAGKVTLGDWYAHVVGFGSLRDIDTVLSEILGFQFVDALLNSEFHGFFEEDQRFHLRDAQKEVVEAAVELFSTRHMLCHEFAPTIQPDTAAVLRMLAVADAVVGLSEIVIFAEAEQGRRT